MDQEDGHGFEGKASTEFSWQKYLEVPKAKPEHRRSYGKAAGKPNLFY